MDGFDSFGSDAWNLAVALGIGLLLGAERERRKGEGSGRGAAGVRTFALVSLLGGVSMALGGEGILIVAGIFVAGAALVSYLLSDRTDPGLTTEVALVTAFLLGALAYREPALAGGLAVVVTVLLAARSALHRFVSSVISEEELHDALIFAAAAFVILPLAPDRTVGPYDVVNPFTIWRLAVLVMAISAAGYIALRTLGPRLGLPLAGFAGGFVSSAATVGAMGQRVSRDRALIRPAVAGAVLSTVATVIQAVIVVGATSVDVLRELALPLSCAGVAAAGYGSVFALRATRPDGLEHAAGYGRAFDLKGSVIFAGTVGVVMFVSAALTDAFGERGLLVGAAAAGFADAHSAAISAASVAAAGRVAPEDAVLPVIAAFTTNTMTKAVVAWLACRGRYFAEVALGLGLVLAAAWGGLALLLSFS